MTRFPPAMLALLGADLVILVKVVQPGPVLDFLPFYVAAELVLQGIGRWVVPFEMARSIYSMRAMFS